MNAAFRSNLIRSSIALLSLTAVVGCSDSDNNTVTTPAAAAATVATQTYRVTLTNLSANQPLSPLAVVLHQSSYAPWAIGSKASAGLELLAEGCNPPPALHPTSFKCINEASFAAFAE